MVSNNPSRRRRRLQDLLDDFEVRCLAALQCILEMSLNLALLPVTQPRLARSADVIAEDLALPGSAVLILGLGSPIPGFGFPIWSGSSSLFCCASRFPLVKSKIGASICRNYHGIKKFRENLGFSDFCFVRIIFAFCGWRARLRFRQIRGRNSARLAAWSKHSAFASFEWAEFSATSNALDSSSKHSSRLPRSESVARSKSGE